MGKFQEDENVELKRTLNADFAKEVVAFLNTREGTIYVGVDDDGEILGIHNLDKTMREVRDIIRDQILPSTEGLCDIGSLLEDDKTIISVRVSKGTKLYYIKKAGRSVTGCYYRDGTSSTPMSEEEIERRFIASLRKEKRKLMSEIPVVRNDLTFNFLKNMLISRGNHIKEDTFLRNYNLVLADGRFNLLADILSDENIHPLAVCIFKGKDKIDYDKRNEYGNTSLIRGYQMVIDYCEALNATYMDVRSRPRKEKNMFINKAFEEAWINACVHNRWDTGISPQVFLFEDRMEIVSQGGIPEEMTKDDFLNGVTSPVNPDLMNIFIKCDICEESGHGVRDIVALYGYEAFEFSENRITVKIPLDKKGFKINLELTQNEKKIIGIIQSKRNITTAEIASDISLSTRRVQEIIRSLKAKGNLIRVGSDKYGY